MKYILILLAFLSCAGLNQANAHAIIINSTPEANATLAKSTFPVMLHFNSRIDHARSKVSLVDADGGETALAISPHSALDTIECDVRGLSAGAYTIHWQVLSVDGHITRGTVPFTIVPSQTP